MKIALFVLIGIVAALALIHGLASPPGILNFVNSHTPGDGNAERVAGGIAYGRDPAQALDVWAPRDRRPGRQYPVLIFYYGGGWDSGARGD